MFCPECGAPNDEDSLYCGNCGAPMDPDETPPIEAEGVPAAVSVEEQDAEAPRQPPDDSPGDALSADHVPVVLAPQEPPQGVGASTFAQTSGMAIASLVMGIAGWTLFPFLGSILAIIFGYAARKEIRAQPERLTGDGLAVAGLVLGWLMVGLSVVGIFLGAIGLCLLVTVSSSTVVY